MNDHIDFYFDIISPYAYIAYKKILKIKDINFKLKPILLGGLHNTSTEMPDVTFISSSIAKTYSQGQ